MENHFLKKFLSLALALVMVLGLLPGIAIDAKAAVSTTVSHSGYTMTLTEYQQTGHGIDVMSGLIIFRVQSFSKSGNECTVVMDVGNNIYTEMANNVWDEFTFTFTDVPCDEALDTTASVTKRYGLTDWYFKVTVRFTRNELSRTF